VIRFGNQPALSFFHLIGYRKIIAFFLDETQFRIHTVIDHLLVVAFKLNIRSLPVFV
jgi:hypothetical protein